MVRSLDLLGLDLLGLDLGPGPLKKWSTRFGDLAQLVTRGGTPSTALTGLGNLLEDLA